MRPWSGLTERLNRRMPATGPREIEGGPLLDRRFLAQIEQLRLADLGTVLTGLTGEHQGRTKTQAIEFADYRGYAPGDDFRQIDWNAYARLGELFVKSSVTEENQSLSLLIDCSRSMDWGRPNKLQYARRLAAALGAIALLHYDAIRVFALGDGQARAGSILRGHDALPVMLHELESLPVASTTELLRGIEEFQALEEVGGPLVLISDFLVPPDQEAALDHLAGDRTYSSVLHLVDPFEADPPIGGLIELRDHETGRTIELSVTPAVKKRYMARFRDWTAELETRCRANQIRYTRVDTTVPPSDLLLGALRRQGLVRA